MCLFHDVSWVTGRACKNPDSVVPTFQEHDLTWSNSGIMGRLNINWK